MNSRFTLEDRLPANHYQASLRADVRHGLAARPRTLSPKWFYDQLGSDLFEEITGLPEYYLTRAEQEILTARASEIAQATGAATLAELGSGSSRKTRLLLDALTEAGTLKQYAPVDVSVAALEDAGSRLTQDYPSLRIAATVADFEDGLALADDDPQPRMLAFLGSTLGNFDEGKRATLYAQMRRELDEGDSLLLGADLVKSTDVLLPAYNDSRGVTAEFNKNVLRVLNRELDADFDLDAFEHEAVWNPEHERIEMLLRSRARQAVKIKALSMVVEFDDGEPLRTEISCKFRKDSLTAELAAAGFNVRHWWVDGAERFALLLAERSR